MIMFMNKDVLRKILSDFCIKKMIIIIHDDVRTVDNDDVRIK